MPLHWPLYVAATILALLAAVGVEALGPLATLPLAVSSIACGLLLCHAGSHAHP